VPASNQRGRVPSRHVVVAENRDSHSNTFPDTPFRYKLSASVVLPNTRSLPQKL
jgi:hypothetical protein